MLRKTIDLIQEESAELQKLLSNTHNRIVDLSNYAILLINYASKLYTSEGKLDYAVLGLYDSMPFKTFVEIIQQEPIHTKYHCPVLVGDNTRNIYELSDIPLDNAVNINQEDGKLTIYSEPENKGELVIIDLFPLQLNLKT